MEEETVAATPEQPAPEAGAETPAPPPTPSEDPAAAVAATTPPAEEPVASPPSTPMGRWKGRVALVTGASAGIGADIAKELALQGMKVVGVARRVERVEALKATLGDAAVNLHPVQCDVRKEGEIAAAFEWAKTNLGGVDVLINNAGVFNKDKLTDGSTEQWLKILETNVLGLCICTREAVKSMKERKINDGHIINVNSMCGHKVVNHPGVAMYTASKWAVTALTQSLKDELMGTRIRTTNLSPGLVRTEMLEAANIGVGPEVYNKYPCLEVRDVTESIVYVLGCPPNVQITELKIQPVQEN